MQGIAQACCRVIILSANAWTKKVTIKIILVTLQCRSCIWWLLSPCHILSAFYVFPVTVQKGSLLLYRELSRVKDRKSRQ